MAVCDTGVGVPDVFVSVCALQGRCGAGKWVQWQDGVHTFFKTPMARLTHSSTWLTRSLPAYLPYCLPTPPQVLFGAHQASAAASVVGPR